MGKTFETKLDCKLSAIKPYEQNAKLHTEEQIQHIANSIERFGFVQPIVVDENYVIIIGHGRYAALQLLKRETAEVRMVKGYTDDEKKALRLADNKINADTGFDPKALESEFASINISAEELQAFGLDWDFGAATDSVNKESDPETITSKLETYLSNTIKQVVFYYESDTYEKVVAALNKMRDDNPELINNSECFLELLRETDRL